MVPKVGLLVLMLLTGLPASGDPSASRVETIDYVAPTVGPAKRCNSSEERVGGACFRVQPGDATVDINAMDDRAGPVGGWYRFVSKATSDSSYYSFCGTKNGIPIRRPVDPWDEVTLVVALDVVYAWPACGLSPQVPTTGQITARFYSEEQ